MATPGASKVLHELKKITAVAVPELGTDAGLKSLSELPAGEIEPHDSEAKAHTALLSACQDELDIALVDGLMAGKSNKQIAEENKIASRTAIRRFQRIRERMIQTLDYLSTLSENIADMQSLGGFAVQPATNDSEATPHTLLNFGQILSPQQPGEERKSPTFNPPIPHEQPTEQKSNPTESVVALTSPNVVTIPAHTYDSLGEPVGVDPMTPSGLVSRAYSKDSFENIGADLQTRLAEIGDALVGTPQVGLDENITEVLIYVTDGTKTVRLNGMPDEKISLQQSPQPNPPTGSISVVELLEKGTSLADIRQHIQQVIAPPADASLPVRLMTSLNIWLRTQDPKDPKQQLSLKDKQAVTEFVELLGTVAQCNLILGGEHCRFDVEVDPRHPEGSFRIRAVGEGRAKIRRARLSDLLNDSPFTFEEIKPQSASESQGPAIHRQGEANRKAKKEQGKKAR